MVSVTDLVYVSLLDLVWAAEGGPGLGDKGSLGVCCAYFSALKATFHASAAATLHFYPAQRLTLAIEQESGHNHYAAYRAGSQANHNYHKAEACRADYPRAGKWVRIPYTYT
jgi:hypothetical protein